MLTQKPPVKKREKHRKKLADKAEKEASAPPKEAPKRKNNEEEDEAKLDPRQYFEIRSRAVKKLKQTNKPNPYPHKFQVTTDMVQFMKDYEPLETGAEKKDVEVRVGGRIYTKVRHQPRRKGSLC